MNLKKIFSFLICTALLLSTALSPFSVTVPAETEKTETVEFELPEVKAAGSGTCGGNLRWAISWTNEVTLTITGTGSMTNYSSSSKAPWYASRNTITKIVIENGVSGGVLRISGSGDMWNFGEYENVSPWYENAGSIKKIIIDSGVASIGDYAFNGLSKVKNIQIANLTFVRLVKAPQPRMQLAST